MTAGEIKEALKDVPDDKKILISGITKDDKECGNLFNILEFDKTSWEDKGGIFKTDLIVDFDALCKREPVKEALAFLKNEIDKAFKEALKS